MFKLTAIKALPLTLVLLAGCSTGSSDKPGDTVSAETPGFVALQKGDNATAAKDLRADNAATPRSAYDELDLGLAYQRQGRMDLAAPLYRQAITDGQNVHPTETTTQWSKDMTVAQIACENLMIGLPPTAAGTAAPCQTTVTVAVVDTSSAKAQAVAFNTYFDFNKSTLTDAGQAQIASAAKEEHDNPTHRVTILGKASNVGSDTYNMALSQRRAATVRDAMIADGVPASKIDINWVGDRELPVAEAAGVRTAAQSRGPKLRSVAPSIPRPRPRFEVGGATLFPFEMRQSMKPLRILLAEDDAMIGLLLADVLDGMGHTCAIAATEDETVAIARSYLPDLMIIDAQLGDGSGIAAVDTILDAGPLPHLFVSGDAARVTVLRPDAIVLQKPFREADLIRAIDQAFSGEEPADGRPDSPVRS